MLLVSVYVLSSLLRPDNDPSLGSKLVALYIKPIYKRVGCDLEYVRMLRLLHKRECFV